MDNLLKQIGETIVILAASEIALKALKAIFGKLVDKIKSTLSTEAGEQVGEELDDTLDEADTEAIGEESSAAG